MGFRGWRRWTLRVLLLLALLAISTVLAALLALRGSLPQLEGQGLLPGLQATVQVQRDALGVVSITADNQADMARALGHVHAQERYFEMDLARRSAAGELSALFGAAALPRDSAMRPHRLRARQAVTLAQLPDEQRQLLAAYAEGVNAGLDALRVRPWPYLLLRQAPQPWQVEDSLLAGLAMYADLQDPDNRNELAWQQLRAAAPPALAALLAHPGSRWDAPLLGPGHGDAPLPAELALDLRQLSRLPATAGQSETPMPGSNNFAVSGRLTADGRAIVADDMHLGLRAPNIWFRARLRYRHPEAPAGQVDVSGFTLPGLPAVIVGSNGHVAWGFTNAYIDNADFARYDPALLAEPGVVRQHAERIAIAGGSEHVLQVRETDFGPLLHTLPDGSALALRWAAQLPGALSLDLAAMAHAADLEQALQVADRARIPAQNLVIGDAAGRIGWRLIGARPDRAPGCAPDALIDMRRDGARCPPWRLRSDAAPALIDPPDGRLWTANNQVADAATVARIGNAGYDLGARAQQIRDSLHARTRFSEADLLAIQLDDRALLMQRWHQLLRQSVAGSDDPALQRLEAASRHWDGHASVDSVSYRLARGFRGIVLDTLQAGLLAPVQAGLGADWQAPALPQLEGIAWPLLEQQPAHLLPAGHASWEALLVTAARQLEADLASQGGDLHQRSWGERNTARICHPLQRALPEASRRWLCMPGDALAGDSHLPRVAGPAFGASQRMVVAPGHERDGIVHMPGGQSGHPLSPFWGAGHDDWVAGRPTPFLPGPALYTLTLAPSD